MTDSSVSGSSMTPTTNSTPSPSTGAGTSPSFNTVNSVANSSVSTGDHLANRLRDELYMEETSPPSYNTGYAALINSSTISATAPSRHDLPEKSLAARQSVASLLRDTPLQKDYFGK